MFIYNKSVYTQVNTSHELIHIPSNNGPVILYFNQYYATFYQFNPCQNQGTVNFITNIHTTHEIYSFKHFYTFSDICTTHEIGANDHLII